MMDLKDLSKELKEAFYRRYKLEQFANKEKTVEEKREEAIRKSKETSKILLEDTIKRLEDSIEPHFKIPEIIIITPIKDKEDFYNSWHIEYFGNGTYDLVKKEELNIKSVREKVKPFVDNSEKVAPAPFIILREVSSEEVYEQAILKFKPYAMKCFENPENKKEIIQEENKLYGELENLEAVLEEVEFKKPEIIIIVPYEMEGGIETSYLTYYVRYKKGWADLGYKEAKIKDWVNVSDPLFIDIEGIEKLIKKYYENFQSNKKESELSPPIVLGNSVKAGKNSNEDIIKSYEAKILKFRRQAIEYWKKHQI